MKLQLLDELPSRLASYDVETWRIRAGMLAPPLVLAAAAWVEGGKIATECLGKRAAIELLALLLDDPTRVIVGANLPFDLLVGANEFAKLGVDVMPEIFAALMDHGRIYTVDIAEMLDAIAEGCLGRDPRTGGPLVGPDTGRRAGYSLAMVTDLVLGRSDAKALGHVATEYEQYDGVPIELLPPEYRDYPQDDVRNAAEGALAQCGHVPRGGVHKWGDRRPHCLWCGIHPKEAYVEGKYLPCRARRRSRNLHDLSNQVGTAWAMHLGASHGFRVDQRSVTLIEDDALEGRAEAEEPFVQAGLLKRNRDGSTSRDMSAICRAVALSYGADPARACSTCGGTRKVVSSKAKPVKCPLCKSRRAAGLFVPDCQQCGGTGEVPDPRALINCTACATTGFDLSVAPNIPKTETGRVGTGRDVLNESGDEILMQLADHQEDAKTLDVYVPYLRRARVPVGGHGPLCPTKSDGDCNCQGPYEDIALTLWPNVLLETGRTSYRGVIQLLPRRPGHKVVEGPRKGQYVPSLRECIRARDGHVLSSSDYESGELVTHGSSCLWICGESKLAEALAAGIKVHNALAATMIGLSYEEFQAIIGDKKHARYQQAKDARQSAKPPNFGYPGLMGAVKLVLQQRKQGPDTPHPSGPTYVYDGDKKVPGYKGLRFCLLMDNAPACGIEKVTKWGRREEPIPPTCRRCIECAKRLREIWLQQWPENEEYFRYVEDCVENGQLITDTHLELWPHLREWFTPGARLAPGEIMQHVSGRVRGGVTPTSCANGFFQALLADLAKDALRHVSRECYDRTVRVNGGPSPLLGSHVIAFQHDELIVEHPEDVAHEAATRVSEVMVESMRRYVHPDLHPACRAEPALMRRWYKSAEPAWLHGLLLSDGKRDRTKRAKDLDDRLIPWEPR